LEGAAGIHWYPLNWVPVAPPSPTVTIMFKFRLRIIGLALLMSFLTSCSRSSGLELLTASGRVAASEPMPLDTQDNIVKAIAAMRYAALSAGLGFPAERERGSNGADSGVEEVQCSDSGYVRFDETAKETTYFACQNNVFGLITYVIDGLVSEDCQGQDGDITCLGYGTPNFPLTYRSFDEDEEIGGEVRSHVVRNLANTAATDDKITIDFVEWRSRPYTAQATLAAEGYKIIQTSDANGATQASLDGAFSISSDEGFKCTTGSLQVETLSTVTMDSKESFVAGKMRLSNDAGQAIAVDFLPNGSAFFQGGSGSGIATAEMLGGYCRAQVVNSSTSSSSSTPYSMRTMNLLGPSP